MLCWNLQESCVRTQPSQGQGCSSARQAVPILNFQSPGPAPRFIHVKFQLTPHLYFLQIQGAFLTLEITLSVLHLGIASLLDDFLLIKICHPFFHQARKEKEHLLSTYTVFQMHRWFNPCSESEIIPPICRSGKPFSKKLNSLPTLTHAVSYTSGFPTRVYFESL